jgi:hypothetical protein
MKSRLYPLALFPWFKLVAGVLLLGLGLGSNTALGDYARGPSPLQEQLIEEAFQVDIPPSLALAVARVESRFDPHRLGADGGRGLMQITPSIAWRQHGVQANELWEPSINIWIGAERLARLLDIYGGRRDLALSHYAARLNTLEPVIAHAPPYLRPYLDQVNHWQAHYAPLVVEWNRRQMHSPQNREPLPRSIAPLPGSGELDDFDQNIEQRRQHNRRFLDDFSESPLLAPFPA